MAYVDTLIEQADQLFNKRTAVLSLWQKIAFNFYPERADFTTAIDLGSEVGTDLSTSYPVLARRDLGNAIGSMLRPTSKAWFHIRTSNYDVLEADAKAWLEAATVKMRHMMSNRKSQFSRATKEGDHDFAAFGQTVLQVSKNKDASGVLYRCWHLRDVAWAEDGEGNASTVYRRWKPFARELAKLFPKTIHESVRTAAQKEPYKETNVYHCILPTENYTGPLANVKTPFVSIYYDAENKVILEEVGVTSQEYIIPRWSTVSGSQYAFSPATITALPDARMLQDMLRVLLEAGEKATNPPMIAVQEAIRSDISIFAGGITWVDAEYDERLGEVLRPMANDKSGVPLGRDMALDVRAAIAESFFLNKLTLPQPGSDMTAYEVGQRVQEYIRHAMPLFAPLEEEYNAPLCEATFEVMLALGKFGPADNIPTAIRGQEITFAFESPLHDAIEREKGQRFLEAQQMLSGAMALDPDSGDIIDVAVAVRDVLGAVGVPSKWTRTVEDTKKRAKERAALQQQAQQLAALQQGANVAKTISEAGGMPAGAGAPTTGL